MEWADVNTLGKGGKRKIQSLVFADWHTELFRRSKSLFYGTIQKRLFQQNHMAASVIGRSQSQTSQSKYITEGKFFFFLILHIKKIKIVLGT